MPSIPDITQGNILLALRAIKETIEVWKGLIGSDELYTKSQMDTGLKAGTFPLVNLGLNGQLYLGDEAVTGSWRIQRSGSDLVIQRYESGAWTTKSTISA